MCARSISAGRCRSSCKELNDFQPEAISGYARVLRVLAEAQERGELRIAPREIGSGGEPLLPDVKAHVERVFQVPVKNGYASSEHLYMAMPLPGAEGMHLLEDDLIFELGADHTCVTNLFNEVLPLIRYRMDDVLIPETAGESPYPFPAGARGRGPAGGYAGLYE